MDFLDALKAQTHGQQFTENGALTNVTSKSFLLDFFSMGGALRTRKPEEIIYLFQQAFNENKLLALKCLFYLRDIRGGQGERRTFKIILEWLASNINIEKLIPLIPEFGRWDDLYCIFNLSKEIIKQQFLKDIMTDKPSLLGKWLKSENTSSKESCELGKKTRKALGLTSTQYRKELSKLRKRIKIIESQMSSNQWDNINYQSVPSRAAMIYSKAFKKHDAIRYVKYLEDVKSGKQKINTGTLYPYDIVQKILEGEKGNDTLDVLWNNLPDYVNKNENAIVVADVSGSMAGLPMAVSISLAIYFAERNKGIFKDHFITFSSDPVVQQISGKTIFDKVRYLSQAKWTQSTNLIKVFINILMAAKQNNSPIEEMPAKVYIISDMEFDQACGNITLTNFETIKIMYEQSGYKMPVLVFWNVDSRNNQTPVKYNDQGVYMVSGCSPVIFKQAVEGVTPYDYMLSILNQERYKIIEECTHEEAWYNG